MGAIFVVAGLIPFASIVDAKPRDTLVVANHRDAKSLDPHAASEEGTSNFCNAVYNKLLNFNPDTFELVPELAEKWELINPTTYRFYLRKGVKFHNGEEFKADDVKFTVERGLSSKGAAVRTYFVEVESAEVVDDYTVDIKLKQPSSVFLWCFVQAAGSMLNRKAVESAGEDFIAVGTGPFKFVDWVKGDKLVMERFDDYYDGKPAFKNLIFRVIVEPATRLIELETGAVDLAYNIPPIDVKRLEANPNLAVHKRLLFSTFYVGFNFAKAPMDNPKVREAIYSALDTAGMQNAIYLGTGMLPYGPYTPYHKYFNKDLKQHVQDVEKSKKLLAELAEEGIKDLNLTIMTDESYDRIAMATMIQSQLQEVGIGVEVKVAEFGAFFDGMKANKHDMFCLTWASSYEPDISLYGNFHSKMIGSTNSSNVNDPEMDRLLDEGRRTPDGPERETIYLALQEKINAMKPWIYIVHPDLFMGAQKDVKGFIMRPIPNHYVHKIYFED